MCGQLTIPGAGTDNVCAAVWILSRTRIVYRWWYATWPVRLRNVAGGNQSMFYCPAADPKCEWKKGLGPGRPATIVEAAYGYEIGEPLLMDVFNPNGTWFSYCYN